MQSIEQVRYKGVFNAIRTICVNEGYRRLMRGVNVMVLGAGPAHAMYFTCYEKMKRHLTIYVNGGTFKNSNIANGSYC